MTKETPLDFDCWQYHIGVLEGALRALVANSDIYTSLKWIREHVIEGEEQADAGRKLDRLISESPVPQERKPRQTASGEEGESMGGPLTDEQKARGWLLYSEHELKPSRIADYMPGVDRKRLGVYLANVKAGAVKKPLPEQMTLARQWHEEQQDLGRVQGGEAA